MKCPIDHWRKNHGFRVGCFIDDGYATADSATAATAMSIQIRSDLQDLGFLYYDSPPKSFWEPDHEADILGMHLDFDTFSFSISEEKIKCIRSIISELFSKRHRATARQVARLAGSIQATKLAIGPATSFFCKAMSNFVGIAKSWDYHYPLPPRLT